MIRDLETVQRSHSFTRSFTKKPCSLTMLSRRSNQNGSFSSANSFFASAWRTRTSIYWFFIIFICLVNLVHAGLLVRSQHRHEDVFEAAHNHVAPQLLLVVVAVHSYNWLHSITAGQNMLYMYMYEYIHVIITITMYMTVVHTVFNRDVALNRVALAESLAINAQFRNHPEQRL